MTRISPKGICFGEVLWDCFPDKRRLGGAPANVAYHAARMGAEVRLISAVGEDLEGSAIIGELTKADVPTRWVKAVKGLKTGWVDLSLDEVGKASYVIHENVAWDSIQITDSMVDYASECTFLVFGSLALRSKENQAGLERLLNAEPTWKIMDVNLRPPYGDRDLVLEWASKANVLKFNDEELFSICRKPFSEAAIDGCIREVAGLTGVGRICVTRGDKGAVYFDRGNWYEGSASKVQVVDTVGAGDAFTASLAIFLSSARESDDISKWLDESCKRSAWVASQSGAMPPYPADQVFK